MFDWLWKRRGERLEFADNREAFAHACRLGWEPHLGALIPALVEEEGPPGHDGEATFLISLANARGTLRFWTCTLKEAESRPQVGDLVGFRVVTVASDLPADASLIGYLACRLSPVLVPGKGWLIARSYTPANIKRDIRF